MKIKKKVKEMFSKENLLMTWLPLLIAILWLLGNYGLSLSNGIAILVVIIFGLIVSMRGI